MPATTEDPSAGPERLRAAWSRLIAALGGDAPAAAGVWHELDVHYTEQHRAYHTWSHIDHVHQVMEWILTRVPADRPAVELAVFFHDAIYVTPGVDGGGQGSRPSPSPGVGPSTAPDNDTEHAGAPGAESGAEKGADTGAANEIASAALARTACSLMDLPTEVGAAVHDLVLATRDHRANSRDAAVLCDADLAILASEPATYDVYRRAIRVEYRHVDEPTFRRGRAQVLERLLERERIYATSLMRDRGEAAARRNLQAELAALS